MPDLKYMLASSLLVIAVSLQGQNIHVLEPIKKHYETLRKLDASPNEERISMDRINYHLDGKNSGKQFVGIEPTYLADQHVNTLKSSINYPANSSDQTQAELDYLLEWEKKRTKAQEERAMEIAGIGYWPPLDKKSSEYGYNMVHLFWECKQVVGENCSPDQYPATLRLIAGVTRDMRIIEFTVKYHLLRARPYHLEPRLNPMAKISSPSFASGHTLWAYIQAFTWSELMPDKRQAFLDVAYEVGESREIMGIHYPSDEEAARVLAHQMLT